MKNRLIPALLVASLLAGVVAYPVWAAVVRPFGLNEVAIKKLTIMSGGTLNLAGTTLAVPSPVAGGVLYSGAANMAASAAGSSGQVLRSGGTGAPTWSTAVYPATAGTAGKLLRSDGTDFASSTLTMPDTAAVSTIPYASSSNVLAFLATANGAILNTNSTGVPSLSQSPTLDGQAARTFSAARHATADTAGNSLTIQGGGATSAATDKAGGDLVMAPGLSTGTGRSLVKVQGLQPATATGTSDNTLIDRLIVGPYKAVANNTTTAVTNATLAANSAVALAVRYSVQVFDGTDVQIEEGVVMCHVTNKAAAIANNTCVKPATATQQAMTAGTLTVTWTITAASPAVLSVNANSSLTPSTGFPKITYVLENLTGQAVAVQ